ncbi:MAG TPA: glycosyltransferase family 4 protein [Acidimicrobiales bacterium]|nr:glycosyltransferase family 4 protein [Acidimicrobiales bacterium]
MRTTGRRALALVDLGMALGAAAAASGLLLLRRRDRADRRGHAARRLLVFDAAYSLAVVRRRGIEESLLARSLDGWFEAVWSVNPLVGADPADPAGGVGAIEVTELGRGHCVWEGRVARWRRLASLPLTNFVLAQAELILRLGRLIRREGIAAIRAGDPYYLGLVGLVLARRYRIPLVVRVNGNYDSIYATTGRIAYPRLFRRRWIEKRIDHLVLSRADFVAGANRDNLDFALRNGADPVRSAVFPYGNLIAAAHWSDPRARARPRDVPAGPYLAWVGRLELIKHPDDVVEVARRVRERLPHVRAVLVGTGSLMEGLEEQLEASGLGEAVVLAGERDQSWIAGLMANASVILSPMTGRALVEAALSARPIVAYDVEWHAEIIRDGVTGVLVPYRDAEAMAEAAIGLISDPAEADRIGRAARADAEERMDPAALAAKEIEIYDRLIPSPVGSSAAEA